MVQDGLCWGGGGGCSGSRWAVLGGGTVVV